MDETTIKLAKALGPVTFNPNLAAQGAKYRANMTPPDSVMAPRYPAWKQAQEQANQFDILTSLPGPGELLTAGKALAGALKGAPALAIFAGMGAKTANSEKLAEAIALQRNGVPREQIWRDTGWFQGPEGKWKFEIDDSKATFLADKLPQARGRLEVANDYLRQQGVAQPLDIGSPDALVSPMLKKEALQYADHQVARGAPSAPLATVLQHGQAFRAYPEQGAIPLSREIGVGDVRGSYRPDNNTMTVGGGSTMGSDPALKSTTLHELQHAIQEREGFSTGGSFAQAAMDIRQANADIDDANKFLRELSIAKDAAAARKDVAEVERLSKVYQDTMNHKLNTLVPRAQADPYEAYRRLAGEAEARAVQSRMNMTPAERQATPPWQSYDMPWDRLIVR